MADAFCVQAAGIERAKRRGMMRSVFVEDAALILGVSRRTVYYRIRDGKLQTVRTPNGSQRVLLQSIELLLREEQAVRAPGAAASSTSLSARSPGT